jgi:hypothetical protein
LVLNSEISSVTVIDNSEEGAVDRVKHTLRIKTTNSTKCGVNERGLGLGLRETVTASIEQPSMLEIGECAGNMGGYSGPNWR